MMREAWQLLLRYESRMPLSLVSAPCVARYLFGRRLILAPLARRARREALAGFGPPGGWVNQATERACVWLVRNRVTYRAVLAEAGRASMPNGRTQPRSRKALADYFAVSVSPYIRDSVEATRYIGTPELYRIDWHGVADWFMTHRVHPKDVVVDLE